MSEVSFTDRELDVMSILWRRGSGTVSEVREALSDPLAYTTVLTVLQTLEEKGHVRHEEEGRAYRYHPVVAPEDAAGSALRRIVDKIFQGSAEMVLAQLVSEEDPSREELRRMRRLLEEELEGGGSPRRTGGGDGNATGPAAGTGDSGASSSAPEEGGSR